MNKIVTLLRLQSSCQTLILSVFYYLNSSCLFVLTENEIKFVQMSSFFKEHRIAMSKKRKEIWVNFSRFLGNRKSQDEFILSK
jgi:hypothetical protein